MKINYAADAPNSPLDPTLTLPGYSAKRGKRFAPPRSAWGMVDANGRTVDPEQAKGVLDEALGD